MRHLTTTLLFLFALALAAQAAVTVPTCILGGATAVNKNRKLAEGERITATKKDLVVYLKSRTPGKKNEFTTAGPCVLPANTEVAVNERGMLVWVVKCGNDPVGDYLIVDPPVVTPERGASGKPGDVGKPGERGERGPQGPPGPSSGIKSVNQDVEVAVTEGVTSPERTEVRTTEDGKVTQRVRVTIPAGVLQQKTAVAEVKRDAKGFCRSTLCRVGLVAGGAAVVILGCRLGHCGGWGSHQQVFYPPATIAK